MSEFEAIQTQWRYYLSLEKQFLATTDFVEVSQANFSSYSNEYAKLLLLTCSEVDVVAKQLCQLVEPNTKAKNIENYRDILVRSFDDIHAVKLGSTDFSIRVKPWKCWGEVEAKSPDWWRAYNDVKHERNKFFYKANLENTISALAGLLTLLMGCWVVRFRPNSIPAFVPILWDEGFPAHLVTEGSIHSMLRLRRED